MGISRLWLCLAFACLIHSPTALAGQMQRDGCDQSRFKIVLDVGHTREASGATSARGLTEYSFNLQLATRISERLRAAGYAVVVITVNGRGTEQLVARTKQANVQNPQLIISIHHDAVQARYQQPWYHDGRTDRFSDKFSGFSLFVSRLNSHFKESMAFAELLSSALTDKGFTFSRHHAEDIEGERRKWADATHGIYYFDELFVLRNTAAPAVLLEAGVIVNRTEELVIGSEASRGVISSAVLSAVQTFCRQ
jgi:N-acetylmuramoyl-L-alanine amidase